MKIILKNNKQMTKVFIMDLKINKIKLLKKLGYDYKKRENVIMVPIVGYYQERIIQLKELLRALKGED